MKKTEEIEVDRYALSRDGDGMKRTFSSYPKPLNQRAVPEVSHLFKGSSNPSHFIFEINVGMDPTYNDSEFEFSIDFESN